jgi:hypothetical protein
MYRAQALTCLRSARESPDMAKKLAASAPVTRPSPSATKIPARAVSIKTSRVTAVMGERRAGAPYLGRRARTTRRRSSRAPWSRPRRRLIARSPSPSPLVASSRCSSAAARSRRDTQVREKNEPDGPPPSFAFPSRLRWTQRHFDTGDPTLPGFLVIFLIF